MNQFLYLGSNISSTESDVNVRLTNVWNAIDGLSIIGKSDLSDKIKRDFFPNCSCVHTTIRMHHIDTNKAPREKARLKLRKNIVFYFKEILEASSLPQNSSYTNDSRRTRHTKHSWRSKDEPISDVLLWTCQRCPTIKDFHASPLCRNKIQSRRLASSDGW